MSLRKKAKIYLARQLGLPKLTAQLELFQAKIHNYTPFPDRTGVVLNSRMQRPLRTVILPIYKAQVQVKHVTSKLYRVTAMNPSLVPTTE